MEIILDGRTVDSRETLHQRLTELLQLPAWYGRNLDALHDCLTELREPVTLRVIHAHALRETLGRVCVRLRPCARRQRAGK